MEKLEMELKELLSCEGASLVGFADLSDVDKEPRRGFNYGISIAVALDKDVIRGIKSGPTREYYEDYKRINNILDKLANKAAEYLIDKGYEAYAQTNDNVIEDESTWRTALPHKTVATNAGLGWIGKCALLVTSEYGSAIRITSVLTNAKFKTGTPVKESSCGSCENCKNACPGKAVSGVKWAHGIDRDKFYNPFDCRKAARARAAKVGIEATMCGACIYACPWTKKYIGEGEN